MKVITIIFLIVFITHQYVSSSAVNTQEQVTGNYGVEFFEKQKAFFNVFQHTHQRTKIDNDLWKTYEKFQWNDEVYNQIENTEVTKEWKRYMDRKQLVGKDEIFSIMNVKHRDEAIKLYNVLYNIKNWHIFYMVMSWARFNMNTGVFQYAVRVVVHHKDEFNGIVLPQPYEVNPHYFFNTNIIQRAQLLKMRGYTDQTTSDTQRNTINDRRRIDRLSTDKHVGGGDHLNFEDVYDRRFNHHHDAIFANHNSDFEHRLEDSLVNVVDDKYEYLISYNDTRDYYHYSRKFSNMPVFTSTDRRVVSNEMLKYFTEDIGLNTFFYWYNIYYPVWMDGVEYKLNKDRRGERFWFVIRQIMARYKLERYGHGIYEMPEFDFTDKYIENGYQSNLRYYNGAPFPTRYSKYYYHKYNKYNVQNCVDHERYIRDSVKWGNVKFPNGKKIDFTDPKSIEHLGNWFMGTPDSLYDTRNRYGWFEIMLKRIIGGTDVNAKVTNYIPNVLEHYETTLNDPMWYVLYDRFLKTIYLEFVNKLPAYKYQDIYFDGVKIESVEMSKLQTYFRLQEYDITNAVDVGSVNGMKYQKSKLVEFGRLSHLKGKDLLIKVEQKVLDHLPFTTKLHVSSDKTRKAIIKMFIGPARSVMERYKTIDHNENLLEWFELDQYVVNLKEGKNVLTRGCHEFNWFVRDHTTYFDLYKQLMLATVRTTNNKYPFDTKDIRNCGLPRRLILPHGKVGGKAYEFFFIVMPYIEPTEKQFSTYDPKMSCGIGSGTRYLNDLPFNFPFDRKINYHHWNTPNMIYHEHMIFHKHETDDVVSTTTTHVH